MIRYLPLAALLALAACSGGATVTPAQVANDVSIIGTDLNAALATSGLNTPAPVTAAVADINAVAKALAGSETMNGMQPLVVRVSDDLNIVIATLDGVPGLPPEISKALGAAEALLPVVETAVGLVVPAQTAAK